MIKMFEKVNGLYKEIAAMNPAMQSSMLISKQRQIASYFVLQHTIPSKGERFSNLASSQEN